MLIFVIDSKDGYLGLIFPFNMIRQGSSGFVGEKMLLGNNGSDLFGMKIGRVFSRSFKVVNALLLLVLLIKLTSKNNKTPRSRNPPSDFFPFSISIKPKDKNNISVFISVFIKFSYLVSEKNWPMKQMYRLKKFLS